MRKVSIIERDLKDLWFNQLIPIWKEYYLNCNDNDEENPIYLPGIPSRPIDNSLLIIGINPSSSKTFYKRELEGTRYSGKGQYLINNLRWARWKDRDIKKFSLERIYDIEAKLGENHPFFIQFERIKELTGFSYSFLDILYIRDSEQKNVVKKFLYSKEDSPEKLFAQKQIAVSLELLESSKPKAIIIANAETSRVIFNIFQNRITGSMAINGRYIINIGNRSIPLLPLSYMKYLSFGVFYSIFHLIKNAINTPINKEDLINIPSNEIDELLKGYKRNK